MSRLTDLAARDQTELNSIASSAASRVVRMWAPANPDDLEGEWSLRAPQIAAVVTQAQVSAAQKASPYVESAAATMGVSVAGPVIIPEAFGGATREGREVAPELYSGVTYTKSLIKGGMGVGHAFRAGTALMSILAANTIRDAGRSAGRTAAVGKGLMYSVRVVQPGACSRCAILAGVTGYRVSFQRHPGCRCTSMPIRGGDAAPEGFFTSPEEYFDSLSRAEQDRVFTKAGAWAIRNGASPISVVNARRGALSSVKRADGSYSLARLRAVTIGKRADGSPLRVYATPEGRTARGAWGRAQNLDTRNDTDRYRRTSSVRLMPEQIMQMSEAATPERARQLLQRYGYLR